MSERVDFDRLADYVGGALDGTPDAAEVRRLVDTDPEWAAAHDTLAAAVSTVAVDLRALGAVVDPVPEAVVARLDDALRHLGSTDDAARPAAEATPGGPPATADRVGRFSPPGRERVASGPGGTGPGRERRRRTARWAAGLSAAAAVIAFGIGVVATFPTTDSGSESTAAGDAAAPAVAPSPEVAAGANAGGAASTGRDYRAGSFDGLADLAPVPFAGSDTSRDRTDAKAAQVPPADGEAPPELARFRSPAAVESCLDAIRRLFGGDVRVTDLARYEGRPAVVVLLDNSVVGGGRPLVVVAGPRCGEIPGDVDEVYHAPLA
ncbi:hypothetical protein [Virgisporangium ochraceum]|uniref:Uncharacterized protein n=1 Tax=Virgisporangium ochraceum TaxID=65505 RepID=A0A8J3ZLC8_9ACTN|nr:hypothetical protein [Virgisporangium ochraceum]GIJ66197.1 hypothetical protein Voc01_011140 [Virgisporangium ochraceum]